MRKATRAQAIPSVANEFRHVDLGDHRREERLRAVAETWSAAPDRCVPSASKSSAMAEATYRLLNNPAVTHGAIVEAHVIETCERVARAGSAIVIHDTSEFAYHGEAKREGLGRLRTKGDQGFLAHTALAVTADGEKDPLGILGFAPWVRTGPPRRKKGGRKRTGAEYAKESDKESERWFEMVKEVSARLGGRASLVHLMDREADSYPLLSKLTEEGHRFVVRLSKDRVVAPSQGEGVTESLKTALGRVKGICEREVPLSRRAKTTIPQASKTFPRRDARVAKLQFSAATINVKKPRYATAAPASLALNFVHVLEIGAPAGADPVEWILVTSEPTATEADILAVVELYRTRWMIEEYFKALKTGCAVEKRQHESVHALVNAVAICLPIAWKMLRLRKLARSTPAAPATRVLTSTQLEVLRACSHSKLKAKPTVQEALYAVAALGGHLRHNGEPGWLVLGRGMEYLLTLELGWTAHEAAAKCDR